MKKKKKLKNWLNIIVVALQKCFDWIKNNKLVDKLFNEFQLNPY